MSDGERKRWQQILEELKTWKNTCGMAFAYRAGLQEAINRIEAKMQEEEA